ncbi:cold-shock protein [Luteipulveratus mongoliensis]|uniref:DNA-binding protein n=1 Tax=Luteipulveratus mongoliensis TaxID=571913 RepID=A0A0K1JQM9_9MICO|nr:cold shock domain-containing protein [Luteipulveratus mongoliensis]AKU19032.1 DNA-binding protein [Luteipulveratus mongoliensis]
MDVRPSIGTVKFWKADKGWGAISPADLPEGQDAFAHFSSVEMDGFRSLEEGVSVEFTWYAAEQDSFEFVADWVKPIG